MSVSINGTNGLTFGDGSAQNTGGYTGFRNRIINGDMRIDQRNAGAVITPTNGQYSVDRFNGQHTQAGKYTLQQSADAPTGFNKSLVATSTSAYSVSNGDIFQIAQAIEGYNISDFAFGTANASPVAISFWVKSSIAGLFSGALVGGQAYVFSFTINSANTWEKKSISVSGSTSGTWETTSGSGFVLLFSLGCGSTYTTSAGTWTGSTVRAVTGTTSIVGTSGATFYITGVQLEKGSVATPFEHRPYGTELSLCQRYYQKSYDIGTVPGTATSNGRVFINFPVSGTLPMSTNVAMRVEMRSAPTVTPYDFNGSAGACWRGSNGKAAVGAAISTNAFSVFTTDPTIAGDFGFIWTAQAEL